MTRKLCNRFWVGAALLVLAGPVAWAQSFCSSDGQRPPAALLERFIHAECEACWSQAGPKPGPRDLVLDWIVPGGKGGEAPLSVAAIRDSTWRLKALRRSAPDTLDTVRHAVQSALRGLRVSHGLPFNGYVGTSIELKAPPQGRWSSWLLLVETIPAGSDGTPIARNLVRNTLQSTWGGAGPLSKEELSRLYETRPMGIPEGATPSRLRVVGWVEDGRGRIRAIAQSQCPSPGTDR